MAEALGPGDRDEAACILVSRVTLPALGAGWVRAGWKLSYIAEFASNCGQYLTEGLADIRLRITNFLDARKIGKFVGTFFSEDDGPPEAQTALEEAGLMYDVFPCMQPTRRVLVLSGVHEERKNSIRLGLL